MSFQRFQVRYLTLQSQHLQKTKQRSKILETENLIRWNKKVKVEEVSECREIERVHSKEVRNTKIENSEASLPKTSIVLKNENSLSKICLLYTSDAADD